MDSKLVFMWYSIVILFLCIVREIDGQSNVFKVTDFGAVADGKTDIKNAIMEAWKRACQMNEGKLVVPLGTFLLSSAEFEGPCNGKTYFQLKGTLKATPNFVDKFWIRFHTLNNLMVFGNGAFDGDGASAWSSNNCKHNYNCNFPPVLVWFGYVKNSKVQNIKSLNSKSFHFHIDSSENLHLDHITITAPGNSPNTDGIHIASSNYITVSNSKISTGDDCVSIGDGNTNINITTTWCGPGHGISIGSLGRYKNEKDVRSITVNNCTISDTTNGLRIKTMSSPLSSLTVSDVTFSNILLRNVQNPIIINQNYCPVKYCDTTDNYRVVVQDVKFIGIRGTSATPVAVKVNCNKSKPCKGIEFSDLNIKLKGTQSPTTASCSYIANTIFHGQNQVPSHCS